MADEKKPHEIDANYAELDLDDPRTEAVLKDRAEALIRSEVRRPSALSIPQATESPPVDAEKVKQE